jgi:hypothetical protein
MVFDHHHSEQLRTGGSASNHVIDAAAPSAARVVYDYFGGARTFTVENILATPDVTERVELYRAQSQLFVEQLRRVCVTEGDLVIVHLRDEEVIHAGNRFMVYALFPDCRVSAHISWGKRSRTSCSRSASRFSTARHRWTSAR